MAEPAESDFATLGGAGLQDGAVKGAAWTLIHTITSVPIAFAVNLLLARVLAPEGYGRLAFLTTLIGIASGILALGLTSAMIQFGSKAHAAGRPGVVTLILSSAQGFRLLVVAPLLTALVLILVDVPTALLGVAIIFGVWVPAALDGAPITLFIENKTAAGARIAMVSNLLVQIGVVIAVLWLGTADAVWAARIVLGAAGIALALVAVAPRYRRAILRPTLPRHFPAGFWRFALPTGAAALLGELALSRTEVLYLTWLSTPETVGVFALAFGVANHVFAPAQALTGPLMPAVSGLREVAPWQLRDAFTRTLRATATVVGLLIAAALPALVVLVPTIYGDTFAEAAAPLLVLGIVGGLGVAAGPMTAFALSRLSGGWLLRVTLVALVINTVSALALIPWLGLWGAVVANASGTLAQVLLLLHTERRNLGVTTSETLRALLPLILGALASLTGWTASLLVEAPPLLEAVLAASVALATLLVALRGARTGLEEGDTRAIQRVLPRRVGVVASPFLRAVTRRTSN